MKNLPVTRKVFILSEIPVCKGESVSTELSKNEKLVYEGNGMPTE